MKIAAITITYNRLDLTKRTFESFYSKTNMDFHLFVDNGSTDGTVEWLQSRYRVLLEQNYGIARAFSEGVRQLKDYDYILKLDNDVEVITPNIIGEIMKFYEANGNNYVVSPVDVALDPAFAPPKFNKANLNGWEFQQTSHTGGAFQVMPVDAALKLVKERNHLRNGDYMIGRYFRRHGYSVGYLTALEIKHIGLGLSTPGNEYIL